MDVLSQLFSTSPFRCLHDHAGNTSACLSGLQQQFDAALSGDAQAVAERLAEIRSRVLVGRAVADAAYQTVSGRVMLPVRREDIVSTIDTLNLMLSACGDAASLISASPMSLPVVTRQMIAAYIQESLTQATMATDVVASVNVLVEVCFAGPEADEVEARINEMQLDTASTDLLKDRLLRTLFSDDNDGNSLPLISCLSLITELQRIRGFAVQLVNRFHLFIRERAPRRRASRRASTAKLADPASFAAQSATPRRATHAPRTA